MLGIAERQNVFELPRNYKEIQCLKLLKNQAKSLGNRLQFQRMEKNLTPGQVAAKMGIAAVLVCSWENGSEKPSEQQLKDLVKLFGVVSV